uniref:Uncharacterized protein n=1 Tax=Caenorhabditis tropicalis TaxID=1561998 RepID=A0A1I7V369_9PELO
MRVRASSYCQMDDRVPFLTPQGNSSTDVRLSSEVQTGGNTLSSSLSTIPITGQKSVSSPTRVLVKGHTVSTCIPHFGVRTFVSVNLAGFEIGISKL